MNLAKNIRTLREKNNLTQEEIDKTVRIMKNANFYDELKKINFKKKYTSVTVDRNRLKNRLGALFESRMD